MSNIVLRLLSIAACSFWLSSCGELLNKEGSKPDRTPNEFDFDSHSKNAQLSYTYYSNLRRINGISDGTPVSISGGEFAVLIANDYGGHSIVSDYSSKARTISEGQFLKVRLDSSELYSTPKTAEITIGDVTKTVSVTTRARRIDESIAWVNENETYTNRGQLINGLPLDSTEGFSPVLDYKTIDWNGDGFLDIVLLRQTQETTASLYLYQSNASLPIRFNEELLISDVQGDRIDIADIDGDNDWDAISYYDFNWDYKDEFSVYYFQDQTFDTVSQFSMNFSINFINEIKVEDIDLDGDLDYFVFTSDDLYIVRNNSGSIETEIIVALPFSYSNEYELVDIDGDLDLDIVLITSEYISYYSKNYYSWIENEGSSFQLHKVSEFYYDSDNPKDFFPYDIDGDGDLDVMYRAYAARNSETSYTLLQFSYLKNLSNVSGYLKRDTDLVDDVFQDLAYDYRFDKDGDGDFEWIDINYGNLRIHEPIGFIESSRYGMKETLLEYNSRSIQSPGIQFSEYSLVDTSNAGQKSLIVLDRIRGQLFELPIANTHYWVKEGMALSSSILDRARDQDHFSFELTDGLDEEFVQLNSENGEWEFNAPSSADLPMDYDQDGRFTFNVRVSDETVSFNRTIHITVYKDDSDYDDDGVENNHDTAPLDPLWHSNE